MKNNIEHVFFDLDHTLWDFDRNSGLTFQKIFKKYNIETQLETFLKAYEPINLNYWKLYREQKVEKPQLRYGRLKDTFDSIKYPITDELISLLSEDYIKYLTTFDHVFVGTHTILKHLQKNYKLHIITNGFEEAQEKKMTSANLRHYFCTVTNSEMAGVKKPHPDIFNLALKSAKAKAANSVMIGDNLEADIEGAKNMGMDVILFNYHKYPLQNGLKSVDKLADLKLYL